MFSYMVLQKLVLFKELYVHGCPCLNSLILDCLVKLEARHKKVKIFSLKLSLSSLIRFSTKRISSCLFLPFRWQRKFWYNCRECLSRTIFNSLMSCKKYTLWLTLWLQPWSYFTFLTLWLSWDAWPCAWARFNVVTSSSSPILNLDRFSILFSLVEFWCPRSWYVDILFLLSIS